MTETSLNTIASGHLRLGSPCYEKLTPHEIKYWKVTRKKDVEFHNKGN